jgi:hypothetical protein
MIGSATQEVEVLTMIRILDEGGVYDLNERANIQNAIEFRKAEIVHGLDHPVARYWTKKLQEEVEPFLRMRFSVRFGFVIDRWLEAEGFWHQIPGTCGFDPPREGLCDRMKNQYDMWKRSSPKEDADAALGKIRHPLMKEKDEKSQRIRASNEAAATAKVAAAVDSLSSKQIDNFLAVERARHTGEKLIHHGPDLKFVEYVEKIQKTTPPPPGEEACGNPGMNPMVYKRREGGKHVREH